jgi:hypothetical protein
MALQVALPGGSLGPPRWALDQGLEGNGMARIITEDWDGRAIPEDWLPKPVSKEGEDLKLVIQNGKNPPLTIRIPLDAMVDRDFRLIFRATKNGELCLRHNIMDVVGGGENL